MADLEKVKPLMSDRKFKDLRKKVCVEFDMTPPSTPEH
jgi:hypothetical protein